MTRPASYNRVWAEDAASDQMGGESATADQSVIEDGWIGSATAEPPTARMQNYWQIRVDLGLQEIERQGCLGWRSDVPYVAGAFVLYASNLFQAASNNTGVPPQGASDIGIWSLIRPGQWPTTPDNITGILPILKGGTGASAATAALSNLGGAPIISPALTGSPTVPTAAPGDTSRLIANMLALSQAITAAKRSYNGVGIGYTTSTTLTASAAGQWHRVLTSGLTLTFPAIASFKIGDVMIFQNASVGALILKANGTEVITNYTTSSTSANSLVLQPGEWVEIAVNSDAFYPVARGNLFLSAGINSPSFTGIPTAPTPAVGGNNNSVATTAFAVSLLSSYGIGSAISGDTTDFNTAPLGSFLKAEGTESTSSTYNRPLLGVDGATLVAFDLLTFGIGGAARITQIATQVFPTGRGRTFLRVKHDASWYPWREIAMTDSPAFTGAPTVPTAASGTSTLQAASTEFVQTAVRLGHGMSRFTGNGSFTVPVGVTQVWVSGCGGGGGGGGAGSNNISGAAASCAGGGGAGQSALKMLVNVTPGSVLAVTIGAGGAPGAGGTQGSNNGTNGSAGGATSMGNLLTLVGGSGGDKGNISTTSASGGGAGGAGYPGGGYGSDGAGSGATTGWAGLSGAGGSSPFGGGGMSARAGIFSTPGACPGRPATGGFGGGGSGGGAAYAISSDGSQGGSGAPGLLIIEW